MEVPLLSCDDNSISISLIAQRLEKVNLKEFFNCAPKEQRSSMLKSLAEAHGRPVSTVYKWQLRGNHPVSESAMAITEQWSGFEVDRFDERPDVFDLKGVIKLLESKGVEFGTEQ